MMGMVSWRLMILLLLATKFKRADFFLLFHLRLVSSFYRELREKREAVRAKEFSDLPGWPGRADRFF